MDEALDYMLDIVEESIEFFCPTKEIKIKKIEREMGNTRATGIHK